MITTQISSIQFLNLDYANARTLLLPQTDKVHLILVGCGGTGSWLAPSVARVARLLAEKFDKDAGVTFIDPDQVEEKNCFRQNFCQAEIGLNKARTLAFRYGLAWGVEIEGRAEKFDADKVKSGREVLNVLIGCVDNAAARNAVRLATENKTNTWWLDCGNQRSSGQVLLGGGEVQREQKLPAHTTWLPLPSVQHPELLIEVRDLAPESSENLSCADLAMQDSQGLAINQRIAAEATDYLVRMLLTKDLQKLATYIDLGSGATRSVYITDEVLK